MPTTGGEQPDGRTGRLTADAVEDGDPAAVAIRCLVAGGISWRAMPADFGAAVGTS
ncbi:hypothetical protein [Streptomyces acidicola]|uniref:Transposase n=1 Tax=Streptomyces acidicola TaxID=2596892 RepID=A0A5N8X0G6_9ACTN|nr:hypothetical protein [Streptomyces acidicola]MPY52328.1 transposase [Streptomyces acidicola]